MQITKQIRTETGHRLTNYSGRCSHLHGHSYLWEVTAYADELDEKNMVMDFKDLKKAMNNVIDPLDHALLLSPTDPLWGIANSLGHDLSKIVQATNGAEPRLFEWHDNPTAESMAKWALEKIQDELLKLHKEAGNTEPMPYFITSVKVWETATSFAEARVG